MVLYGLFVKVDGEHLSHVGIPDDFTFAGDFSSGGICKEKVTWNFDSVEEGVRALQNLTMSFGGKAKATLSIEKPNKEIELPNSSARYGIAKSNAGWSLIAIFELRGMELTKVHLDQVNIVSQGGTVWTGRDPVDFCEYCEKSGNVVTIESFETKVETIKAKK
ncbi:putative major facilitator superfamily (ISS) protein [Gregarina niphandrodes]|uniref:Major facilitator superfamily (ISS) protein n=1 Tax=Gregarina niphandrodes TaxID=110365 RepID=A0A023BB94_GRENI|nr:putative major facilitator superfamily (ISS) protein [Gregarina niphandrodes]EZG79033.1 putative major facilitator superfamily (ISS) protein [Gregarina niphandrodes]|eukprot:XP_011129141.1 putative major facilitator superfamily (ISS) protein [Gregarina niphandrodes]